MEYIFFILFFILILIPLILGHIIPIYRNHKEATGDIINYDSYMCKFVYKVNWPSEVIITKLATRNDVDDLFCSFDSEKSIVRISEYGSHRDYYYQIIECDGFCILKLELVQLIGTSSQISLKLNPFMIDKIQAETIPFSEYK